MVDLKVSVITPVFNAGNFITQAVESALAQPETAEVILIEDGSPDGSLQVCQKLADKYENVHLLQHPGGVNKGAGASRNLGMQNVKFDYIAFLDADDFFLPGRFTVAKEIFEKNLECDGVYEALGIYFENEEARLKWLESDMKHVEITTMTKRVKPEELFENLIKGGAGYFSLDALVFKRFLISEIGYMNEDLLLHQDTDYIFRLAATGKLFPGRLNEPVAMRRVHGENRISRPRSDYRIYQDRMKTWIASYLWCKSNLPQDKKEIIVDALISFCVNRRPIRPFSLYSAPKMIRKKTRHLLLLLDYPPIVFETLFWKRLISKGE